MTKRLFSIGLMSVVAVAGFCSTGEACHHRRARNAGRHGGGDVHQVNSGCCSNAGYVHSSGPYYGTTSYGANDYGHQGVYGNQGMHGGQGYVDGNVGGNVISNRVILGR